MSKNIGKRKFLIDNIDHLLELLAYHREWNRKMDMSRSAVLWSEGEKGACKIHEIGK